MTTPPLSRREQEVLRLLGTGQPNKLIAHALGISEHTVKVYVQSLRKKLGVTNRTHAIVVARERGLLP